MYQTKLNHSQKVCTAAQWKTLVANHQANNGKADTTDFKPVVKFFNALGAATWLISECDEDGIAYGLCDLGQGSPEIGSVSLTEVCDLFNNSRGRRWIERDLHFKANKTLTQYADQAREKGRIVA